ncbi:MAG TPA: pilus assembly protein TadG-related protein [Allosphingosinicella sp.]|uniref:pilus assembly protein TadG-related protein n=1 Tax=Allosphingosinicella sp. TaxID=2823234 RepID=UPI002ED92E52
MQLLKRLYQDKKGNVLMIGAAAMPLVIGSAALAVDTIQASLLRRHLQRAADSGALAGAYAQAQSEDIDSAVDDALAYNDAFPLTDEPTITLGEDGRSVNVSLRATRSLPFWSFFGEEPDMQVQATAALVYSGKYCMVSLDESTDTGIDFSGSGEVDLKCGVIANSRGNAAVSAGGNGKVIASPVAAGGNIVENPDPDKGFMTPTIKLPYSMKQEDPYEDVPEPVLPNPCSGGALDAANRAIVVKYPGCYSASTVQGTLLLKPGTYYITGAVNWHADALIKEDSPAGSEQGITLIFMNQPSISINAKTTVKLTPPATGDYAGLIMYYYDPNPTSVQNFGINGSSTSAYTGGIYFPTHKLTFNGNATMNTTCIKLVAKKLVFLGNVKVENTCPTDDYDTRFDAEWVRLVA